MLSAAGELVLVLSPGGGPTDTRLSAWQGCTPLPHPWPWGEAVTARAPGSCGLLPQQDPGDAVQHPRTWGDLGWSKAQCRTNDSSPGHPGPCACNLPALPFGGSSPARPPDPLCGLPQSSETSPSTHQMGRAQCFPTPSHARVSISHSPASPLHKLEKCTH